MTTEVQFLRAYFELESTRFERANLASDQTEERDMDVDGYEIAYSGKLTDSLSLAATYSNVDGKNGQMTLVKFQSKLGHYGWTTKPALV